MVKLVSDVLKEANLIGNAFSTQNAADLFENSAPQANLTFANSRVRPHKSAKIVSDFKDSGAYRLPERIPLRVVVVNTLADEVKDFLEALKRSLERDFKLSLEVVRERNMRVISQANLESAVRLLQKEISDLVMVFLPDETDASEESGEGISDRYTRAQTIGRGLPCLIVHEATLNQPEAMLNVIMGLIARAGAVPYLLADTLSYADRVVGLSLVYHSKREGDYLTGIARIYGSDGACLRGVIAGAPVTEREGIPDELLAKLLPRDLLRKQRILLHFDGQLRRDEQRALGSWEDELDTTIYPVEVIRAGVPRMFALNGGKIEPPSWGSILRLSDQEAFLQSSDSTIQPLHIRCEEPLKIEQATHSVLLFTLLHYGALATPKLPVTVHNADPIEGGILRGIMPPELETTLPFWL
jgi:argonaute-like protein implicated in RNA metabolism and viral defense